MYFCRQMPLELDQHIHPENKLMSGQHKLLDSSSQFITKVSYILKKLGLGFFYFFFDLETRLLIPLHLLLSNCENKICHKMAYLASTLLNCKLNISGTFITFLKALTALPFTPCFPTFQHSSGQRPDHCER